MSFWMLAYAGAAAVWIMFIAPLLYSIFIKRDIPPEVMKDASERIRGDW
jgi:hypothetical protein